MFARGAGYWWPMSVAVAFLLFLLTGTLVPANRHFRQTPDGVPVYVVSNGFHTDVVVPIREARSGTNWLRHFPDSTFQARFGRCSTWRWAGATSRFIRHPTTTAGPGLAPYYGRWPPAARSCTSISTGRPRQRGRGWCRGAYRYPSISGWCSSWRPLLSLTAPAATACAMRPATPPKISSSGRKAATTPYAPATTKPTAAYAAPAFAAP